MSQDEIRQKLKLLIFKEELKQIAISNAVGIRNSELNRFIKGWVNLRQSDLIKINDWMNAFNERKDNV